MWVVHDLGHFTCFVGTLRQPIVSSNRLLVDKGLGGVGWDTTPWQKIIYHGSNFQRLCLFFWATVSLDMMITL